MIVHNQSAKGEAVAEATLLALTADSSTSEAPSTTSPRRRARLRFGVVGYGYWGPQLVRNLDRLAMGEVAYIADLSPERRQSAQFEFPG
ncbi:MAG: hypothetical protein ACXWQ5_09090, partial [Ktedonobacterales bacterium]